jgi:hypothetical protein
LRKTTLFYIAIVIGFTSFISLTLGQTHVLKSNDRWSNIRTNLIENSITQQDFKNNIDTNSINWNKASGAVYSLLINNTTTLPNSLGIANLGVVTNAFSLDPLAITNVVSLSSNIIVQVTNGLISLGVIYVPPPNLLAGWDYSNLSNNVLKDISGNGNDFILTGSWSNSTDGVVMYGGYGATANPSVNFTNIPEFTFMIKMSWAGGNNVNQASIFGDDYFGAWGAFLVGTGGKTTTDPFFGVNSFGGGYINQNFSGAAVEVPMNTMGWLVYSMGTNYCTTYWNNNSYKFSLGNFTNNNWSIPGRRLVLAGNTIIPPDYDWIGKFTLRHMYFYNRALSSAEIFAIEASFP